MRSYDILLHPKVSYDIMVYRGASWQHRIYAPSMTAASTVVMVDLHLIAAECRVVPRKFAIHHDVGMVYHKVL